MSQRIALVRVVVPLATTVLLAGGLAAPSIATADDDALAAKKKKSKKKRYASITGTLSKRGYTVIALAKSSAATTRRIKGRKFRLRPPASRVTLHLRAPNGVYAGPIVLRGRSSKAKKSAKGGKKAIVGVNAGARLGKVRIKRRAGYALAKTAGRWLDRRSVATARKGVPIGARNFGRVRVRKLKGGNSDRDRDGIPTSLDIDDDGDLVLDNLDATTGAKKSTATASAVFSGEGHFETITILDVGPNRVQGGLGLPPPPVVNANAPGLTEVQIQSALRAAGILQMDGENDFASVEVNCGPLVYCSRGGTGKREGASYVTQAQQLDPNPVPFPECCDSDRDGFGSLERGADPTNPDDFYQRLQTHAGADQIRGGDLLIAQTTVPPLRGENLPDAFKPYAGGSLDFVHTLDTVFATTPAIASYTDELGVTHPVSYPSYADNANPLPVVDGPDPGSDVSVTFHLWRPQRRPVPDELPAGARPWVDVGGLDYLVVGGPAPCPQSSYTEVDPNLTLSTATRPGPFGSQVSKLNDSAPDRAADPANTLSFTLNISQCVGGGQIWTPEEGSIILQPGETHRLSLTFNASEPLERGRVSQIISSTYSFVNRP